MGSPKKQNDFFRVTEASSVSAASGLKQSGGTAGPLARAGNAEFNRKWSSGMWKRLLAVCGGNPGKLCLCGHSVCV